VNAFGWCSKLNFLLLRANQDTSYQLTQGSLHCFLVLGL